MAVLESIERYSHLGGEFLVWLWWLSERDAGKIQLEGIDDLELELGRGITFESAAGDARKVQLQGDQPARSPEARAALYENKLPRKCALHLRLDGADWKLNFDAQTFAVTGMSIPAPGGGMHFDQAAAIRLELLERFTAVFEKLYQNFLDVRLDSRRWDRQIEKFKHWIAEK